MTDAEAIIQARTGVCAACYCAVCPACERCATCQGHDEGCDRTMFYRPQKKP